MSNAIRYVIIEEPVYNDLVAILDRLIAQLDRINVYLEPKNVPDKSALDKIGSSRTYLSMDELSNYLQLSDVTIYRYIKEYDLPSVKFGSQRRFIKTEIDTWVLDQKIKNS